ncbi:uncharacterized protein LOC114713724 [Neltuma alba]|uniref:uncharacterized protein LOC114713724 n=1 Tax=Neltuma alba TaxID=207710 RepID=UPI0010A3B2BF|nr:uncharacterized protein LOC114713724 [Prosopis alba]
MNICTGVATTIIPDLLRKAWEELQYQRKHKSYVQDFKNKQEELLATVKSVELMIDEAKKRNETQVEPIVEHWLKSANEVLHQDTKPAKCFGLCTNCCSQIAQAKELEKLTKERISKMIAKVEQFPKEVAYAAGVPSMEFYSQEFMSFESRKAKFEKLRKELEDENNKIIGLHGMAGTGKSTMAIEVGKQIEKSNSFDRVMFVSVSTPVDEKMIRDDIAKQLELQLEEEKLLTHAEQIWIKIAYKGRVLIILDDVWEKLDLKNLGIQPGFHRKGRCTVLLTTHYVNVCTLMECQKKIKLEDLDANEALNLFLFHVGQDCPDDLKKVAVDIVNECGRLPVMVVAMAKSLKDWPPKDWQRALIALRSANEPSSHGIVDDNMRKFYNSLKLSYTYLKDKQAQVLFLLCSIFPKAYEIPIELLSRIAIGLGLFGEADKYDATRSQVYVKKNKLINSSLLLRVGEECVKMNDLIRKVAMKIANEEIQVIMDSKTNLKENIKYSSWVTNAFPSCFDDSKLEVLLVWINTNGSLEISNSVFGAMKCLRVLLLHSKIEFGRTSALLLPKSIQSLKHIRTLSLINWELGDISVLMRNLRKLESLELSNCSIIELPKEIGELDKLRFLSLIRCSVRNSNPFEVIPRCLQLEELYYVSNDDQMPQSRKVPQITTCPNSQIYHIDGSDFSAFDSSQLDASIKKCFKPAKLQRIFSNEVIKSLAARAEILELEGDNEAGWSNLIPDIVSIEDDGAAKDLIKLSLKEWSKMKCLIYTDNPQHKYGVTIFSKLIELQLDGVAVTEICCGQYPDSFLKQLEKLELIRCQKLESTLFKGKLELGNLKFIKIKRCSMTCLFHPSTAQSLENLETLKIARCSKLKYIISDEGSSTAKKVDDKDPTPIRSHDSMFPKLKQLNVVVCDELEFILPTCFYEELPLLEGVEIFRCEKLKYMFGQYSKEGGLHQMQKENALPSLKVMSIECVPSFVSIYEECYLPEKSVANTSEESKDCKDKSPSSNVSWGPLCCFLPKSETANTTSRNKYVGNRAHGIFTPPLYRCYVREGARELKYVFGKSCGDDKLLQQKQNTKIHLPALNRELPISSFIDVSVERHEGQGQLSRKKLIGMRLCNLKHLSLASFNVETIYDLEILQIASPVNSSLKTLILRRLDKLRNICVGQKNHLSFQYLSKLDIYRCDQLKFVLPTSISRGLTCLRHLEVSDCGELERIIEDDDDEECSFPNLHRIIVEDCERLKCLLSISTRGSFPQLSWLSISDAPEMEQVFGGKQGATRELHIKHVFPKLFVIILEDLPKLHTICPAIDFQTVICRRVEECPKLSLTSTDNVDFIGGYMDCFHESENAKGNMDDDDLSEQLLNRAREVAEKVIKRDRPAAQQNNGSSNIKEITEACVEDGPKAEEAEEADEGKDSEQTSNNPAPSQIKEITEASDEDSPKSEEATKAGDVKDSEQTNKSAPFAASSQIESPQDNNKDHIEGGGKRITLDQQALSKTQPDMHLDDSQKNSEASVGETSNKIAMPIPSTTTETSSPLIPSISTPMKPQISSLATETKAETSQSDHLDIYITESAQDEIKASQTETCMPYVSKQLEDDELMRLFQTMEEGAAHEDDITKALADLEVSLKMNLNEIASSEESRLCLQNSLHILSSHSSDDGLKATIHSLQQEIETILSSFKQACSAIDATTKLEQKEKLMVEQRSQRKEAAMTLLSEIHKTQNSMVEAQTREEVLKEQISKLQDELCNKEKVIKECEVKLSSLQEQKKKCVSDTMGFKKELEAVKKERSHMVVDQIKARHQLENVNSKWSSCLANLKKTSLHLGIHLKQKL